METITINGREYKLYFGIDFIREMDKRYTIDTNGFKLGVGLQSAAVYLMQGNPVVLADIILAATHTLKSIPSVSEIEKWIESQEDIDKVFNDFLTSLKNAPLTKKQVRQVTEAVQD